MGILSKLLSKKAGKIVSRTELMGAKLDLKADLRKAKKLVKEKNNPSAKRAVKSIQLDIKKLNKLKPVADKPEAKNKSLEKALKDAGKKSNKTKNLLDPTPNSPRSAILQAQGYKGKQAALENELDRTKYAYEKLKDKTSEKAMMMRNKIKDMQKKLKGKKQIPMLPQGKNKGGLIEPTVNQTGLKKLPTSVRNKMGYMYGGGMPKKPRMSNMDYRKGGLVIMIGQAKPMKKGKK